MLTITKLRGAEYLIASVADGMEDYYMGAGEAPGVWTGHWSGDLGLAGVVEADALRALVTGRDPKTGTALLGWSSLSQGARRGRDTVGAEVRVDAMGVWVAKPRRSCRSR